MTVSRHNDEQSGMNRFASAISRLRRFVSSTGCQPLLIITAACLLVQEQYPFSNFPMYSSFGPTTYYLYIADGTGAPIPTLATLGISTPKLKKVFSSEMRKARERLHPPPQQLTPEEKQAVGQQFLAKLKSSPAARARKRKVPAVLRLYEVNISLESGRFEKKTEMIAELR